MFTKGQKVRCEAVNLNGIIAVDNHSDPMYPIEVEFEDGSTEVYTSDGAIFYGEGVVLTLID